MDGSVLRGLAGENIEDLALDILHPQSPLPVDYGMKGDLMDTGGITQASFPSRLAMGMRGDCFRSSDISRPSGTPAKKSSQATSSPASPLDWPGSPQPLKKMKGEILEQIKEVRLMLAAEDKRTLADAGGPH